jgi:hypothetical protein
MQMLHTCNLPNSFQKLQAASPGKRLTACNPDLVYAQGAKNSNKTLLFFKAENFLMGDEGHTLFWPAVSAAQVAAVSDG